MRTLVRERLQLEAMSKDWGPEGKALAEQRIVEIEAAERQIEDLLAEDIDGEGAEEAFAVNTAPAPVDEEDRSPEDSPNLGFSQALDGLAVVPDTVAVAEPDTIVKRSGPAIALVGQDRSADDRPARRTVDMELGVGASD